MKKVLLLFLVIILLTACNLTGEKSEKPETTPIETDVYYDEDGNKWIWNENIRWSRNDNVLRVAGEGTLKRKHLRTVWSFWERDIEKIVIEDGITAIGKECFSDRYCLLEVYLPSTLKTIARNAFSECYYIKKIEMKQGIEFIENGAFYGCYRLENINIPEGVKRIEKDAFAYCTSIRKLILPKSLEEFVPAALYKCSGLSQIVNKSSRDWQLYKTGMMKGKWYSENECVGNIIPAGKTIKVKPKRYPITYDLNGGNEIKELPDFYEHTEGINLSGYVKRDGYQFICWRREDGEILDEGGILSGTTGAQKITACWIKTECKKKNKNKIRVSYELDSGDSAIGNGGIQIIVAIHEDKATNHEGWDWYDLSEGKHSFVMELLQEGKTYEVHHAIIEEMDEQLYEFSWEYEWRSKRSIVVN